MTPLDDISSLYRIRDRLDALAQVRDWPGLTLEQRGLCMVLAMEVEDPPTVREIADRLKLEAAVIEALLAGSGPFVASKARFCGETMIEPMLQRRR